MTAQVAADLRAAAEVLRRDGWCQGAFSDSLGRCCARGAIHRGLGHEAGWPTGRSGRAAAAFSKYLESIGENPGASGARYNDAPGRTADEVIAALEAAADAAEPPDCIHISSCEPGDHTRSWPCDYAPGTGKYAADAAEDES